jgi:hypothetical protein
MYRPVPLCDISQVVRTGTYYIILQVGTGRYVPVRTDMYQVYRIPDVSDGACSGKLREATAAVSHGDHDGGSGKLRDNPFPRPQSVMTALGN